MSRSMISMPVMYTIDVACEDCDCKKAVHAHKLMPSGAYSVQEERVCSCQHPWVGINMFETPRAKRRRNGMGRCKCLAPSCRALDTESAA